MTVVFFALVAHSACESSVASVADVKWQPIQSLKKDLAFYHRDVIVAAHERLRQKALYSMAPAFALPDEFTLTELQPIHEVIIGTPLNKKSFRRRLESAEILDETGKTTKSRGRPAKLYQAKAESKQYRFIRNLEG